MDAELKAEIVQAHRPTWVGFLHYAVVLAAFAAAQGLLVYWCLKQRWWQAALVIPVVAFLMHGLLMAFHEASHRSLCPWRPLNDAVGVGVGAFSLMPLTVYRALHRTHHDHLAGPRDEEMWPFSAPGSPRTLRVFMLFVELFVGLVFMPMLCLRTFLRRGSHMTDPALRRRAWAELALIVLVWGGITAAAAVTGKWMVLLVGWLAPAMLAGNIQGWRECIEHMGLRGDTPLSSTRSVVPRGPVGRFIAFCWFNIDYHGVHHLYGSMPETRLRRFARLLEPVAPHENPPYRNYRSALAALLRSGMTDPKCGVQWGDPGDKTTI